MSIMSSMLLRNACIGLVGAALALGCTGDEAGVDANDAEGTEADDDGAADDDADDDTGSRPGSFATDDTGDDDTAADDDVPADDDTDAADDDTAADDDDPATGAGGASGADDDIEDPTVVMGSGGSGGSGTPTPNGGAGGTDTAPVVGLGTIGSPCGVDGDCLSGLFCLNEDMTFFGGVVPNGMCSMSCADDPFVCQGVSMNAVCLGDEDEAYCQQGCTHGTSGQRKCREDQLCFPLDEVGGGACDPKCRDDLDCPEGLLCELASGLCTDMPYEGNPIGEACLAAEDCEGGVCLFSDGSEPGLCGAFCTLLPYLAGCSFDPEAMEPAPGLCDPLTSALLLPDPDLAFGDLGLCAPTCDSVDDCGNIEGIICEEFTAADAEVVGRAGVCRPDLEAVAGDAGAP